MFVYRRFIRLEDTDATGVIFFPNQLKIALETFENYLRDTAYSLKKIIDSLYLMPVVHAEADYLSTLETDDELSVSLSLEKVGNSSFTLSYSFFNHTKQTLAGNAKVTHVFTSKETKKSFPIPDDFKQILTLLSTIP